MRTSALFVPKNFRFFEINGMSDCPHEQERLSQCGHFTALKEDLTCFEV